jgi:hypothetical protein
MTFSFLDPAGGPMPARSIPCCARRTWWRKWRQETMVRELAAERGGSRRLMAGEPRRRRGGTAAGFAGDLELAIPECPRESAR